MKKSLLTLFIVVFFVTLVSCATTDASNKIIPTENSESTVLILEPEPTPEPASEPVSEPEVLPEPEMANTEMEIEEEPVLSEPEKEPDVIFLTAEDLAKLKEEEISVEDEAVEEVTEILEIQEIPEISEISEIPEIPEIEETPVIEEPVAEVLQTETEIETEVEIKEPEDSIPVASEIPVIAEIREPVIRLPEKVEIVKEEPVEEVTQTTEISINPAKAAVTLIVCVLVVVLLSVSYYFSIWKRKNKV